MTRALQLLAFILFAAVAGIVVWCGEPIRQAASAPPMTTAPHETRAADPVAPQALVGADSVQAMLHLRRRQREWLRTHPGMTPVKWPSENLCNVCGCCSPLGQKPHITRIADVP